MFASSNICKCTSGYHDRIVSELRFPVLFRVMHTRFADTKKKMFASSESHNLHENEE